MNRTRELPVTCATAAPLRDPLGVRAVLEDSRRANVKDEEVALFVERQPRECVERLWFSDELTDECDRAARG